MNDDPQTGMERFELDARIDILPVFNALAKSGVTINVRIEQLGIAHTTRLMAVNPVYEELLFDATGLAGAERLDGSAGLSADAQMDAIWFRFEAGHVEAVRGHEQPMFRARIPSRLTRLQRRDSMRYPVPALNPPVCDIGAANEGGRPLHLRAIDISISGIALLLNDAHSNVQKGMTLTGGTLQLPDVGAIATDLAVMYVSPYSDGDQRRLGCRFTNMRQTSLSHLRRYVGKLERARLEARGGA